MTKICVCGSFGYGKESLNGQTIKTEIVTKYYLNTFGSNEVRTIDTQGVLNFLVMPIKLFFAYLQCKNIIILPAHNSLRVLAPLCRLYQVLAGKKTHYFVIGGWLPHYLPKHKLVFWGVRSFYGIYAETNTMKSSLEKFGLKNVYVLPNCKYLDIEKKDKESRVPFPPLKLCTFSRVNRKKGIGDAVAVIDEINKEKGNIVVTLDIFGRVDSGEQDWFEDLRETFPESIKFKGAIPYEKSVSTLKDYHALLFPTRYYTEGIPGTIIDAYAAGLPVIASKWESCEDIVFPKKTGYVYEFENQNALKDTIIEVIGNYESLISMRDACIKTAYDYLPENVLNNIKLK